MRIFSASLALCEWGPPVTGGFPLTGTSDVELWLFLWPAPQQTVKQIMETPVIWDASDFDETNCLLMAPNMIYYYIRQQWLRRWLAAYRPKTSPKPIPIWDYWHPSQFCYQILSNQSVSEQNTALLPWCMLALPRYTRPRYVETWPYLQTYMGQHDQMCMFSHTYSTRYMSVKFQSEHKYFLFFKWTIIVRLRWTTTLSYWGRTIMANFSDIIFICSFFCEFIVFRLKFLRNLLTWVQLTMSQCWLKLRLSAKQRHAITGKKLQPSLLTQNLRHLMNKWSHSAWISAVFWFD